MTGNATGLQLLTLAPGISFGGTDGFARHSHVVAAHQTHTLFLFSGQEVAPAGVLFTMFPSPVFVWHSNQLPGLRQQSIGNPD